MEFVKNRMKEIWDDQSFVSSQMDGVESRLVALEKVASPFSHFIIEHWVPAQVILIDLHNSTFPSCQRADGMANNGSLASEPIRSDWATLYLSLYQTLDRGRLLPSLILSLSGNRTFCIYVFL